MEYKMRNKEGSWYLREMCRDLRPILQKFENPIIHEIGSYEGESAEIFAQEFPFAKIICIDPWKSGYDDADDTSHHDFKKVMDNFFERTKYLRGNICNHVGDYKSFINRKDLYEIPNMVYIDGLHSYEGVKSDIELSLSVLKPGCIISGHDYHSDESILKIHPHIRGVKKAVDEILGQPDKTYKDGSWYKMILK